MKQRQVKKSTVSDKLAVNLVIDKKSLEKNPGTVPAGELSKASIPFLLNPTPQPVMASVKPSSIQAPTPMTVASSTRPAAASRVTILPNSNLDKETKHTRYNNKEIRILDIKYGKGKPYIKHNPNDPTHAGIPVKTVSQNCFNRKRQRVEKAAKNASVSIPTPTNALIGTKRTADVASVLQNDKTPKSLAANNAVSAPKARFFQSPLQRHLKTIECLTPNGQLRASV